MPYARALELQEDLVRKRREGTIEDTLVLVQHPHVITMGSSTDPANILADEEERAARGIELHKAGRGGDVTYHGPGQLVAYPILDLKPDRKDLHRYLRDLETVLIGTAAEFGVDAERDGTAIRYRLRISALEEALALLLDLVDSTPKGESIGDLGHERSKPPL